MLIWSGAGLLVPVIAGIGLFAGSALVGLVGDVGWSLGVLASGIAMWFLGRRLNDKPAKLLVDPETGEEVLMRHRNDHTFFFIPMQWWGAVVAVLGLLYVLSAAVILVMSLVHDAFAA